MENERRKFFRIEDEVLLRVVETDLEAALAGEIPAAFADDSSLDLVAELQRIDHDNQALLNQLCHDNRELELYLRGINKKIELLARHAVKSQQSPQQKQTITLSEGGMAFHAIEPFNHDTILAVQLYLLPSYASLLLYAKVLNCQPGDSDYNVSVVFTGLTDSQRQLLARHIMQVQMAAKRQQSDH